MAASDPYNYSGAPSGIKRHAVAVTPDDATDLPTAAYGLWVGGAGNVKVDTAGGETVTFNAVPAGTLLPVVVFRVYATGTTATSLVALS